MARRMGHGPRCGLAVVVLAAAPYLAGCDAAPPEDGALDFVQVCASYGEPSVRLPDSACQESGPTGRTHGGTWQYAALPPSPTTEVEGWATDEDGELYSTTSTVSDPDSGDFTMIAVGSPFPGGRGWSRSGPPISALDRTARGFSPSGGTVTRSGGGSAGVGTAGSRVVARAPVVKSATSPGSGTVSRGGLGLSGPSGKSGSSGS